MIFFVLKIKGILQRPIGTVACSVIGLIRFTMKTDRSYCRGCCQVQQTKQEETETHTQKRCQVCGWLMAEWPHQPVDQTKPAPRIQTDQPASPDMAAQWFKKMRQAAS